MSSGVKVEEKLLFVTVGTTQFDVLVDAVCHKDFVRQLESDGFTKIVIQYGRGKAPSCASRIPMESFDFAASLNEYMLSADVILCHAGAGSIMEALSMQKHTIVVINNDLMDNHQLELAHALERRHHIGVISHPSLLPKRWGQLSTQSMELLTNSSKPNEENDFIKLLHNHMGLPHAF
mmetsp:Transcript_2115/g.1960  ORF Transcript_2115/g.1960 Transcript_2115/m.1960 type:complete len:178 (-) Transcript_2115:18-551(-)